MRTKKAATAKKKKTMIEGDARDRASVSVSDPLVCRIDGAGIHVDLRVDDSRSIRDLAKAISSGISSGIEQAMDAFSNRSADSPGMSNEMTNGMTGEIPHVPPGPLGQMASMLDRVRRAPPWYGPLPPTTVELASIVQSILARDPAPDDADVEQTLALLSVERDRRTERRS